MQMKKRPYILRLFRPGRAAYARLCALFCCCGLFFGLIFMAAGAGSAPAQNLFGALLPGQNPEEAAQDAPAARAEKSWLVSFIEARLSGPNHQIRLTQIEGAFSGQISAGLITIADRNGIWLKIHAAKLDWNRLALLRGLFSVNSLRAEKVEFIRRPAAAEKEEPARPLKERLALPQWPVNVDIKALAVDRLVLGEELAGQAADWGLRGRLSLKNERLEADIEAARLDGAAGSARLAADYDGKTGAMQLDSRIDEGEGGLFADLLALEGRPSLAFSARGHGSHAQGWQVKVQMAAAAQPLAEGTLNIYAAAASPKQTGAGGAAKAGPEGDYLTGEVTASGAVAALLPAAYRSFFGANTALVLRGAVKNGGGWRVDDVSLKGDNLALAARAETTADGFLRRLWVDGALGGGAKAGPAAGAGAGVPPIDAGAAPLPALRLNIDYGAAGAQTWSGRLSAQDWQSAAARVKNVTINMGGAAENLDNAALRHISAALDGRLEDITLPQAQGGAASLPQIVMHMAADWRAGQPLSLRQAEISGAGLAVTAQGAVAEDGRFDGTMRLAAANLADLPAILGQKLAGSVDVTAQGAFSLKSGAFDILLAGGAKNLRADKSGLNGLLAGNISLSGGLARRNSAGISARNLRLANGQFQLYANGDWSPAAANMDFGLNLADMALLMPFANAVEQLKSGTGAAAGAAGSAGASQPVPELAGGAVTLRGAARGHNGLIAVAAQAAVAEGQWNKRAVRQLQLNLNAMLDNSAPAGVYRRAALTGAGLVGGANMQLGAALYQPAGGGWRVDNIRLALGEAALDGFLQQQPQGGWSGALRLKAENIAPLAALALMEGKGKADIAADLRAQPAAGSSLPLPAQSLTFRANIAGLSLDYPAWALPGAGKRAAEPWLQAQHLQGEGAISAVSAAPHIAGALTGAGLHYGHYNIDHIEMNSRAEGSNSVLTLAAELQDGWRLAGSGTLAPLPARLSGDGGDWQFLLQSFTTSGLARDALPLNMPGAASPAAAAPPIKRPGAAAAAAGKQAPAPANAEPYALNAAQPARFVFHGAQLQRVEGLAVQISRAAAPARAAVSAGQKAGSGGFAPAGSASGFIKLEGSRENWALSAQNVPLALADIFRPDWGLRGRLSGAAHLRQAAQAVPAVDFDLKLEGAGSAALARAGFAPLNGQAQGQTRNNVLDFTASLASSAPGKEQAAAKAAAAQVRLRAGGKIFLAARQLQIEAGLDNMTLALLPEIINRPELAAQNWRGAVTGQAVIEGRFDQPQARFTIGAEAITAAFLTAGKIAPLAVRAEGRLDKQALQLDRLALHESGHAPAGGAPGGDKPYFTAAGRLPFSGAGLKMQAEGRLPLALANGFLPAQNIQLNGVLTVNGLLAGSWQQPQMQGHFAVQKGQVLLVPVNFRLQPVAISGRLQGSDIIFDKAVLPSFSGGAVQAGGTLGVNPQAGFPLHVQLQFNRFQFNDGATIAAEINGALAIGGAILPGMDISGALKIAKAEIRIPDNFGSTALLAIDNKRLNAPIALTQKRAGRVSPEAEAAEKAAGGRLLPRLNIEVSAPNQIFVRGRGLSAEMGGKLHLLGRVDDMRPNGGFKLIRGRFDILAQRLIFREGQVNLAGSLNPDLNFVAVSSNDDVTVTIQLTGTPKNLKIALSSTPSLPQDEILARLVFKRSLSELSPLQVAQLVDAAAELTGATQGSVFGKLRAGTGLDNLDITTDAAGNAGLAAGHYIMDKLYMGVETSSAGDSKGTVNLDISKNLKAKGAMGSDSNSSVGVFYERDY